MVKIYPGPDKPYAIGSGGARQRRRKEKAEKDKIGKEKSRKKETIMSGLRLEQEPQSSVSLLESTAFGMPQTKWGERGPEY